jgi:hypothetical protein
MEDPIMRERIIPSRQITIGKGTYDIFSFVKWLLKKDDLAHPFERRKFTGEELHAICLGLGVDVNSFEAIWPDVDKQMADYSAAVEIIAVEKVRQSADYTRIQDDHRDPNRDDQLAAMEQEAMKSGKELYAEDLRRDQLLLLIRDGIHSDDAEGLIQNIR